MDKLEKVFCVVLIPILTSMYMSAIGSMLLLAYLLVHAMIILDPYLFSLAFMLIWYGSVVVMSATAILHLFLEDLNEKFGFVLHAKNAWSRNRPDMFRLRLQLSVWGWSTSPKEKSLFRDLQNVLKETSPSSHGKNIEMTASKLFEEWNVRKNNNIPKDELEAWLDRNVATISSAKDQNLGCETFENAFESAKAHVNAH